MTLPAPVFKVYQDQRLLLALIFLLSVFVSVSFLFALGGVGPAEHAEPGTDYLGFYKPLAENILAGKGFLMEDSGKGVHTPGFPLLLAFIFVLAKIFQVGELQLIVISNVFFTALSACFLFLLAKEIFNKKIGLISAFLWLSYPFNLWFIKNPNTEVPFIALFFLGLWLSLLAFKRESFWFAFGGGIVFGLAALVRPSFWLFIPFFLVLIFLLASWDRGKLIIVSLRKRLVLVFLLLVGALAVILPWELHVFFETGRILPLGTGGSAAITDGLTFGLRSGAAGDQVSLPEDVLALMERATEANLSSIPQGLQFLSREMVEEPVAFWKLIGLKMARSWYATSQMWWEGRILMVQLVYLISGLVGLIYLLRRCQEKLKEIVFMLAVILYFWGLTIMSLSILRYMVPVMGLVVIFSAIPVLVLLEKVIKIRKPSL